MKKQNRLFLGIFLFAACIFLAVAVFGVPNLFTLDQARAHLGDLREFYHSNPGLFVMGFVGVYVTVAALGVPGALILTLLAGSLFGWKVGALLVSFASTTGACVSFLLSRYFFQSWVEQKYLKQSENLRNTFETQGIIFLLSLRLAPVVPYFLINVLMGITRISLPSFAFVSAIGMFPATVVYVSAGVGLANLQSISDILSRQMFALFCAMALLPWLANWVIPRVQKWWLLRTFQKPKAYEYNFVVIGAGSAGLVAANLGAKLQAKVALIEKASPGGDCLNHGCVPSKSILSVAKAMHGKKNLEKYTGAFSVPELNFKRVREHYESVIASIAPHDSFERYRSLGVDCLAGEAEILGPFEVKIGNRILTTKNIIVATGARPNLPELPGVRDKKVYTSDTIWTMEKLPERLLVMGGGAIGCELGQAFARLGSKVFLVDRHARILPREDEQAAEVLHQSLLEDGVAFRFQSEVVEFKRVAESLHVVIQVAGGRQDILEVDAVLIALGRKPNHEVLQKAKGLGKLIPSSARANGDLSSTFLPNLFFCGDVIGPHFFTHAAGHQGSVAALNALFGGLWKFPGEPKVLPRCTFTDPEIASVGMGAGELNAKGMPFTVAFYPWLKFDRALAEGDNKGFVKIFLAKGSDKILGATIVGARAGEILQQIVFAMHHGKGLGSFISVIQPYPSYADSVRLAALAWKGEVTPKWIFPWLRRFHNWSR